MARSILVDTDHAGVSRILGLPNAVTPQEPATLSQLNSAIEGLAWKDSARVATQSNINVSSPGTSVDGIILTLGDRVLVRSQTTASENGIYIFNGSASAMTRSLDANTTDELEQATLTVEEGSSAGVSYRQTAVNFTLGTGAVTFSIFGTSVGMASETATGVAEIATQSETDAGTDDLRIVTPLKLANYAGRAKRGATSIGDGSATSFTVTHNLGTREVVVAVYQNSNGVEVLADVTRSTVNAVVIGFAAAPTANQYRVVVIG